MKESVTKENVTCPFCGCLCDNLKVKVEDGEIIDVKNVCAMGRSKFLNHGEEKIDSPKLRKDGELVDVSYEEAVQEAVNILNDSKFPLIYGLSSTGVDAQRKAVELAEKIGATIDNTASFCHGPSILAIQTSGAQEASLGEIRNRADLIVFWGCNPAEAHVLHPVRYSVAPEGMYISGKSEREIINVDVRETTTSKLSDVFLRIEPGKDYELFSALNASLRGYDTGDVAGVSSKEIKKLVEKMKNSDFGVIFFGLGLTLSSGTHVNIEGALDLVRELNEYTKFAINPMRGHFNVTGANAVMSWTTGYPFGVNFSRGYPVYGPGEYTAIDVLAREESDSALIIASDPGAHFPASASGYLEDIPTILIDPKKNATTPFADVVIPSATVGIDCRGTAYRMDKVPLELDKIIDSDFWPDRKILGEMTQKVEGS